MAFEHISLLAQIDDETGKSLLLWGGSLVTGAIGWWAQKVWLPGIQEGRERREKEFNAKLDREERIALATIEEMKTRTIEEKKHREDSERRRQEENEKTMLAMETRGARETSHIQALNAVAAGQIKFENEILKFLRDTRGAMKAVLRKLDEDFDFEGDDDEVPTQPADGKPAPG